MFWDNVAGVYDLFADIFNKETHKALIAAVSSRITPYDAVLECACGTGLLTGAIAKRCRTLLATDFSANMLKRAKKKYGALPNVTFRQADILHLDGPDGQFDVVIAANVIHLLDEPYKALAELDRVCRSGGTIIVPTYMNRSEQGKTSGFASTVGKAGADFKRQFTFDTYKQFIAAAGYDDVDYAYCPGRVPCAVRSGGKSAAEEGFFALSRLWFSSVIFSSAGGCLRRKRAAFDTLPAILTAPARRSAARARRGSGSWR